MARQVVLSQFTDEEIKALEAKQLPESREPVKLSLGGEAGLLPIRVRAVTTVPHGHKCCSLTRVLQQRGI